MRKLSIFIALIWCQFFILSAQNEKLNQLFEKYQEVEGVTSIKIAKPMFGLLSKLDIKDSELESIKPLLGKIQGLKIMIIENEEEADSSAKSLKSRISNEITSSVNKLNLEELMTVNSKGSKIKFLSGQTKDGVMDNLLLNIYSEGNTVLMMLDGKISMDDINKLVSEVEVNNVNSSSAAKTHNSSSTGSKEERKLDSFNGVSASSGIQVVFTQASSQKVIVTTDSGNLPYIKTEVKNGILHVGIDKKGNNKIRINKAIVTIEAPKLQSLAVSSGANFNTNSTVSENKLEVNISSGGTLRGDFKVKGLTEIQSTSGSTAKLNLSTERLEMKSNSGASVSLDGSASKAELQLSSAASVDAFGFKVDEVEIDASSAASLKIHVNTSLISKATSGASVLYSGNPTMKSVANSGGGSTKQK